MSSPPERHRQAGGERTVPVTLADLAVAIEHGDHALVLFMNDVGYATCDLRSLGTDQQTGGGSTDPWPHGDWLPGPVQRLLLTSTSAWGGDRQTPAVSGRRPA
ncbi:hypothetical protein [Micromonospora fluostatini]|uniref:hypothetical protein n=1 Tax=Micromonospora sp. JCM 30529 TaxID=3421643 RepID=UPI003D169AEA